MARLAKLRDLLLSAGEENMDRAISREKDSQELSRFIVGYKRSLRVWIITLWLSAVDAKNPANFGSLANTLFGSVVGEPELDRGVRCRPEPVPFRRAGVFIH